MISLHPVLHPVLHPEFIPLVGIISSASSPKWFWRLCSLECNILYMLPFLFVSSHWITWNAPADCMFFGMLKLKIAIFASTSDWSKLVIVCIFVSTGFCYVHIMLIMTFYDILKYGIFYFFIFIIFISMFWQKLYE